MFSGVSGGKLSELCGFLSGTGTDPSVEVFQATDKGLHVEAFGPGGAVATPADYPLNQTVDTKFPDGRPTKVREPRERLCGYLEYYYQFCSDRRKLTQFCVQNI